MKIAVNGAKGKMGRAVVEFVTGHPELTLAGEADVDDDLPQILRTHRPDVLVDFTAPVVRMQGIAAALQAGVAAVVGTTGYNPEDFAQIRQWVAASGRGCLIAPNFQVGNVLMQLFAQKAAAYFDYAEIIEFHHEQKADYPSGTAIRTAQLMAQQKARFNPTLADSVAKLEEARGGDYQGIRLHAVRMPGFVASQEVIFGSSGQTLKIRHDSIDRASYMPGVLLACRHIASRCELIVGLENILALT